MILDEMPRYLDESSALGLIGNVEPQTPASGNRCNKDLYLQLFLLGVYNRILTKIGCVIDE